MPSFKVAHIHEQGQDMIVVPVESNFGASTNGEQSDFINELQMRSLNAGLKGTIVPIWVSGRQVRFIAPTPWHPFFQSISMSFVHANINREIYW